MMMNSINEMMIERNDDSQIDFNEIDIQSVARVV